MLFAYPRCLGLELYTSKLRLYCLVEARAASFAKRFKSIFLLRYKPKLALTHVAHHVSAANVARLCKLFIITKESIHILGTTPDAVAEQFGPLFPAMNDPNVPRAFAKKFLSVHQRIVRLS